MKHIGASTFEKIWENASPSSNFAAQTITLTTDYTVFAIVSDNGVTFVSSHAGNSQAMTYTMYNSSKQDVMVFTRKIKVTANQGTVSFAFEDGYYVYPMIEDGPNESETMLKPRFIYGVF